MHFGEIKCTLLDDASGGLKHDPYLVAYLARLEREPDLEVVAQAGSLAEARGALGESLDVAVVDRGLPDGGGGELIGELLRASPGAKVLVLSATVGPEDLDDLRAAGADAVLAKVESPPIIAEEVRRLVSG